MWTQPNITELPRISVQQLNGQSKGVSEGLVRAKSDRHRGVEVHISADRHKLQLNHQAATATGKVGNIIFGESMSFSVVFEFLR